MNTKTTLVLAVALSALVIMLLVPRTEPVVEDAVDVAGILLAAQRPVVALAGLGMAVFLALRILGTLRLGSVEAAVVHQISAPSVDPSLPPAPPMIAKAPVEPVFQVTDPDMTARVVRSWMKDA